MWYCTTLGTRLVSVPDSVGSPVPRLVWYLLLLVRHLYHAWNGNSNTKDCPKLQTKKTDLTEARYMYVVCVCGIVSCQAPMPCMEW